MSLLLLWMATAGAQDCPEVDFVVNEVEENVLNFYLEDAEDALRRAELAFACDTVSSPELLARLWNAEAMMATFQSRESDAMELFAAAGRVSPDTWNENYGDDAKQAWILANTAKQVDGVDVEPSTGGIELRPALFEGWSYLVDGEVVEVGQPLVAGVHLIQLTDANGNGAFAKFVSVMSSGIMTLNTDLKQPDEAPEVPLVADPDAVEDPEEAADSADGSTQDNPPPSDASSTTGETEAELARKVADLEAKVAELSETNKVKRTPRNHMVRLQIRGHGAVAPLRVYNTTHESGDIYADSYSIEGRPLWEPSGGGGILVGVHAGRFLEVGLEAAGGLGYTEYYDVTDGDEQRYFFWDVPVVTTALRFQFNTPGRVQAYFFGGPALRFWWGVDEDVDSRGWKIDHPASYTVSAQYGLGFSTGHARTVGWFLEVQGIGHPEELWSPRATTGVQMHLGQWKPRSEAAP